MLLISMISIASGISCFLFLECESAVIILLPLTCFDLINNLRVHVVPGNTWVEVLLQDLDAALTVALMATGLETAKLETGRTNVIAVGKEVI